MVAFVWRGAGIMVPITLLISAWLTGYSYDDESISNISFMSWMLLWSGIFLTLLGFALFPFKKDPETQKWLYRERNDFLWIPIFVWGLSFLGFSVYLFNKEPDNGDKYASYRQEVEALNKQKDAKPEISYDEYLQSKDSQEMPSGQTYSKNPKGIKENERVIKFFNPQENDVEISFAHETDAENSIDGVIPSKGVTFITVEEGTYTLSYPGYSKSVEISASETVDSYDTDDVWFILGKNTDLLLVDVSETSYKDLTKEDLAATDWSEMVKDRYTGTGPIEVKVKRGFEQLFCIRDPYYSLPVQRNEAEQIFALIPIPSKTKTSDEYLDYFLENLCFKSDEFEIH